MENLYFNHDLIVCVRLLFFSSQDNHLCITAILIYVQIYECMSNNWDIMKKFNTFHQILFSATWQTLIILLT